MTSNSDVKGNIVEGSEGYAPIDFEAFLRSPLTEKASYFRYGRKLKTNVELYKHAIAEIEEEAERHGIDFAAKSLSKATEEVAELLKIFPNKMRQKGYDNRANNLETNITLILEEKNDLFD